MGRKGLAVVSQRGGVAGLVEDVGEWRGALYEKGARGGSATVGGLEDNGRRVSMGGVCERDKEKL